MAEVGPEVERPRPAERESYESPEITVIATVAEATLGVLEFGLDMGPQGSM
ncbi:MAG TPA: hypothetical protein VJT75_16750 [Thermoleophilaceae bacterium]|nr:hypothetical protein [Thermoleophilaceae bacterium]